MTGPIGDTDLGRRLTGVRLALAALDEDQGEWESATRDLGVFELARLVPAVVGVLSAIAVDTCGSRPALAFRLRQLEAGLSIEVGE